MISESRRALEEALALWGCGETEAAWKIAFRVLTEDPTEPSALCLAGLIYERKENVPIAYQLFRRVTEAMPNEPRAWLHLGRTAAHLWRTQEAEKAYLRCLALNPPRDSEAQALANIGAIYVDLGRWDKAEIYARKALAIDPELHTGRANLGFAQLATRQWAEGWKNYHYSLGTDWRKVVRYKNEPEWDGSPGKRVVLYGEQGLGDEICFASMVNDVASISQKVILDVDPRLEKLFKRSFPNVKVYGTRNATEGKWEREDRDFDCSLAMGQAGEYLRLTDDSFPADPYLTACPDRAAMWHAHFAAKGKPAVGIAWSGGIAKTGAAFRNIPLADWLPIFQSVDAHFVSLQYKSAEKEIAAFKTQCPGVDLVEYHWATITKDYDDTAALVAALDCVVSVPTSVVHLAGALGTPTIAMKSDPSCWKFASGLPFHPRVKLIEHEGPRKTIANAAKELKCLTRETSSESLSGSTHGSRLPITSCSTQSAGMPVGPLQ